MNERVEAKPIGGRPLNNRANEAATKHADGSEHIALNADTTDAEILIRNMRFMSYGIGYEEGATKELQLFVDSLKEWKASRVNMPCNQEYFYRCGLHDFMEYAVQRLELIKEGK